MKLKLATFSIAAALIATSVPAVAKNYPDGGVTGQEVAADLVAMGQKAKVSKDSGGDPLINASFDLDGTDIGYVILFYGCKSDRCTSVQFVVTFDGNKSKITEWNSGHRFARAFTLDEGSIAIAYDVDVEKGANTAAIQNAADRWKAVMVDAVQTLG